MAEGEVDSVENVLQEADLAVEAEVGDEEHPPQAGLKNTDDFFGRLFGFLCSCSPRFRPAQAAAVADESFSARMKLATLRKCDQLIFGMGPF